MIFALLLLGFIVVVLLYAVGIYNRLVRLKNLVKEAWSTIDVMLKKRHDLIPNLVETVKGYAAHEKGTLESVIQARSAALGATSVKDKEAAENNLNKALVNVLAVAEQYPDLKASANFRDIQTQLAALEGDIEKSRRYYNGTARDLNILIESFPSNVIAGAFNFEKSPYFEIDNRDERNVPQIRF